MSELTASDRDILRKVFERSRDRILGAFADPNRQDGRAALVVALADLGSVIEGASIASCDICGKPHEEHAPEDVLVCAVERRTAKMVEAVRIVQTPIDQLYQPELDELPENVIEVEFRGAPRPSRDLLNIPKE